MSFGVYRIVTPSGKYYVGMTLASFDTRWTGHLKELRRGVRKTTGLLNAYRAYGWDSFRIEILESWEPAIDPKTTEVLVLQREQYWWDYFLVYGEEPLHGRPTGTGSVFHSEESKANLRATIEAKFLAKHGVTKEQVTRGSDGRLVFLRVCIHPDCGTTYGGKKTSKYCSRTCAETDPSRSFAKPKKPRAAMKAKVVGLREAGLSWRQVSEETGISARAARRHVNDY